RSAFLVPLARSRPAYVEASLAQDRSAKKLVRDDARKPMQLCLMAMHSCLAHDRASKLLNGGVCNLRTATLRQLVAYGAMLGVLTACGGEGEVYRNLRIYHNPYAEVNWESDVRIKAQHHDHVAVNSTLLQAYDAAGYNAVSLMDYSGNPALPYAWRERIWPPEKWIPQTFLAKLSNVRILIPNAEEVVDETTHVTSPFLTTYVERLLPGQAKQPW